jgi:hypothetical protein
MFVVQDSRVCYGIANHTVPVSSQFHTYPTSLHKLLLSSSSYRRPSSILTHPRQQESKQQDSLQQDNQLLIRTTPPLFPTSRLRSRTPLSIFIRHSHTHTYTEW